MGCKHLFANHLSFETLFSSIWVVNNNFCPFRGKFWSTWITPLWCISWNSVFVLFSFAYFLFSFCFFPISCFLSFLSSLSFIKLFILVCFSHLSGAHFLICCYLESQIVRCHIFCDTHWSAYTWEQNGSQTDRFFSHPSVLTFHLCLSSGK